jgi:hypothetical protein
MMNADTPQTALNVLVTHGDALLKQAINELGGKAEG